MAFYKSGSLPTQEKTIRATTSQQIVLPDSGYTLEKVTVNPQTHSTTFTPTTRSSSINMGEQHNYRYVNTNSVPNSNSGTYPATSRGSSLDMGSTNTYRYVDTTGVPNGKAKWFVVWYNTSPSSSFSVQTVSYKGRSTSSYTLSEIFQKVNDRTFPNSFTTLSGFWSYKAFAIVGSSGDPTIFHEYCGSLVDTTNFDDDHSGGLTVYPTVRLFNLDSSSCKFFDAWSYDPIYNSWHQKVNGSDIPYAICVSDDVDAFSS